MFEPNSAPDSFAPSHCSAPDFDVLDEAAAVLDEELNSFVNEGMAVVVGIASNMLVDEVNVKLEVAAKSSTAGEEIETDIIVDDETVAEDELGDDEAGSRIRIAEEDVVGLGDIVTVTLEEDIGVEVKEVSSCSVNEEVVGTDMIVEVERISKGLSVDDKTGNDSVEWNFILLECVSLCTFLISSTL